MVSINQCPICGSNTFSKLFDCTDHSVSHESFEIKICTNCTLGITSPRPIDTELERYYQSENYISHSGTSKGLINQLYLLARKYTLHWKANLIKKYSKKGTVLDYGCGTGDYLKKMIQHGYSVLGVEPSEKARAKALAKTGVPIYETLTLVDPAKTQIITMWHVLEHIPNLNDILQLLHHLINNDGTLFIAVPNYESPDANHYQNYWGGYDVPRHLWHFNKKSITHLLENNGFKLQHVLPMKLDAFYISMLSENYQSGLPIFNFIKGFMLGLLSNLKARPSNNYSSLIYIASKA